MDGITLESLAEMICGDNADYPLYRKGHELTSFFQRVGFSNFTHDGSTRKWWTLGVLHQLSENNIKAVVLRLANPREYRGNRQATGQAIAALNEILNLEGLKVQLEGVQPRLVEVTPQFSEQPEEADLKPLPPPDFLSLSLETGFGGRTRRPLGSSPKVHERGGLFGCHHCNGLSTRGHVPSSSSKESEVGQYMCSGANRSGDLKGEAVF